MHMKLVYIDPPILFSYLSFTLIEPSFLPNMFCSYFHVFINLSSFMRVSCRNKDESYLFLQWQPKGGYTPKTYLPAPVATIDSLSSSMA